MPGRDFEKAIQEKAQQLRLDPSPAVWQGVAEQLKQRRRKRGVAWLLLAAAIISGLVAVWLAPDTIFNSHDQQTIASGKKQPAKSQIKLPIETNSTFSDNEDSRNGQTVTPENNGNKDVHNSVTGQGNEAVTPVTSPAPTATSPGSAEHKPGDNISIDKRSVANKPALNKPSEKKAAFNKPGARTQIAGKHRKNNPAALSTALPTVLTTETASSATAGKQTVDPGVQATANDSYAASVAPDATQRNIDPADINGIDHFDRQIAVMQPVANTGDREIKYSGIVKLDPSRKKGWYPSVHLVLGASSLQEDVLKQYNTFANEYQNTTMIPTGLAAPQRRPSDVKTGPAFQVGMNINRYFGNKVSVGAGIHYVYLSNRIEIGSPVDSAYYDNRQQQMVTRTAYNGSGNNGESFHNRYHLLQVPVEFNWNIDRKEKLSWNGGIALGYLIGSDAMQYNKQAGVYYRDNDALRKWQAGLFSGIQYNFLESKGIRYSAGPFIQYQITSLEVAHTNKHQLLLGVGGRMHLKKIR